MALTPASVYNGFPPSENYNPDKADIVALLTAIQTLAAGGAFAAVDVTLADLPNGTTSGDLGLVLSEASDGGLYEWSGSAWVLKGALPFVLGGEEYAQIAQAWAESETAPDPDDATSKSAKTWASASSTQALLAQQIADGVETTVLDSDDLPAVTSADNGRVGRVILTEGVQIWQVVAGAWEFQFWLSASVMWLTRAEAVTLLATYTDLPDGYGFTAGGLQYEVKSGATVISDMPGVVPAGTVHLEHFNVFGYAKSVDANGNFDAPGSGDVTRLDAEETLIQAAFDWSVENGVVLHGDQGRVYTCKARLVLGEQAGTTSYKDGFGVRDFNLRVIGGTWPAPDLSDPDPDEWTFGTEALRVGKLAGTKHQVVFERVKVDCARIGTIGILYDGVHFSKVKAEAVRALGAQQIIGNGSGSGSCTNTEFRLLGREWAFNQSPGFGDLTERTSVGLVLQGADALILASDFYYCKHSFIARDTFNGRMSGCWLWNGGPDIRADENSITAILAKSAGRIEMVGNRIDDGQFHLHSFNHQIVGNDFIQYPTTNMIHAIAHEAGETMDKLQFVGNRVNAPSGFNDVAFSTQGSGSFAAQVLPNWSANLRVSPTGDSGPFLIAGRAAVLGPRGYIDELGRLAQIDDDDVAWRLDVATDGTLSTVAV